MVMDGSVAVAHFTRHGFPKIIIGVSPVTVSVTVSTITNHVNCYHAISIKIVL